MCGSLWEGAHHYLFRGGMAAAAANLTDSKPGTQLPLYGVHVFLESNCSRA